MKPDTAGWMIRVAIVSALLWIGVGLAVAIMIGARVSPQEIRPETEPTAADRGGIAQDSERQRKRNS